MFALIRGRVKTIAELLPMTEYFFTEDFPYDEKAVGKKLQKDGVREILETVRGILASLDPFSEATADKALHDHIEASGIGFGAVMAPLRIALTGTPSGPDMFPMLEVLGRDRVLNRIDRAATTFLA